MVLNSLDKISTRLDIGSEFKGNSISLDMFRILIVHLESDVTKVQNFRSKFRSEIACFVMFCNSSVGYT